MNYLKNLWNRIKTYFLGRKQTFQAATEADINTIKSTVETDVKEVEAEPAKVVAEVKQAL